MLCLLENINLEKIQHFKGIYTMTWACNPPVGVLQPVEALNFRLCNNIFYCSLLNNNGFLNNNGLLKQNLLLRPGYLRNGLLTLFNLLA